MVFALDNSKVVPPQGLDPVVAFAEVASLKSLSFHSANPTFPSEGERAPSLRPMWNCARRFCGMNGADVSNARAL